MYFPPKEADPAHRPGNSTNFIELPDKGTVTTFAIVNIPFAGQRIKPPYVAAYVLLDGADIEFLHLIQEIRRRPRCRWACGSRRSGSPATSGALGSYNIEYFKPTGEPDADYDTYKHHL